MWRTVADRYFILVAQHDFSGYARQNGNSTLVARYDFSGNTRQIKKKTTVIRPFQKSWFQNYIHWLVCSKFSQVEVEKDQEEDPIEPEEEDNKNFKPPPFSSDSADDKKEMVELNVINKVELNQFHNSIVMNHFSFPSPKRHQNHVFL